MNPKTVVVIQRNIRAHRTQYDGVEILHDLTTLLLINGGGCKLFILKGYSNARAKNHRLNLLFYLARSEVGPNALIVLGDFNAPRTAWRYSKCIKKGRDLWYQTQIYHFTLQSDLYTPTQIGNSAQKDSTPHIYFTLHVKNSRWSSTDSTRGRDHFIIQTDLSLSYTIRTHPRPQHLTNWDEFRSCREAHKETSVAYNPLCFQKWVKQLVTDTRTVTKST